MSNCLIKVPLWCDTYLIHFFKLWSDRLIIEYKCICICLQLEHDKYMYINVWLNHISSSIPTFICIIMFLTTKYLIYIFFSVLSYMVVILIFFSLFWSTFCQKYSVHGHLKNYIWAVSMFDSIYLTRCILHWLHFIVIVLRYWYMYIILCYAFEYKVQILSKTLIDVYAKAKEYLLIIICK